MTGTDCIVVMLLMLGAIVAVGIGFDFIGRALDRDEDA